MLLARHEISAHNPRLSIVRPGRRWVFLLLTSLGIVRTGEPNSEQRQVDEALNVSCPISCVLKSPTWLTLSFLSLSRVPCDIEKGGMGMESRDELRAQAQAHMPVPRRDSSKCYVHSIQ